MLSKNQIREIQSLQLKKMRAEKGLFLVEGIKMVSELMDAAPQLLRSVYATAGIFDTLKARMRSAEDMLYEVTEQELEKISMQTAPSGVVAVCFIPRPARPPAFDFEKRFTFFLDDIRDPGNFGTMLRLAAWFGIDEVFCSEGSCELYNPKVIQSSMGAFLHVRVTYTTLDALIRQNKPNSVYGAVLDGENLYDCTLGPGLIVIGNEANGISDTNMQLLSKRISIPSAGAHVESLNAAMAAGIILSEFYRRTLSK